MTPLELLKQWVEWSYTIGLGLSDSERFQLAKEAAIKHVDLTDPDNIEALEELYQIKYSNYEQLNS